MKLIIHQHGLFRCLGVWVFRWDPVKTARVCFLHALKHGGRKSLPSSMVKAMYLGPLWDQSGPKNVRTGARLAQSIKEKTVCLRSVRGMFRSVGGPFRSVKGSV